MPIFLYRDEEAPDKYLLLERFGDFFERYKKNIGSSLELRKKFKD